MGSMSKKLLHKTLRVYTLFSLALLVISAPLFYYATERLFIDDADEALFLFKKEFITNTLPDFKNNDIAVWNRASRDVKIEPETTFLKKDSVFDRFYLDTLANENEPYRVLLSPIRIEGVPYTLLARINLIESGDLILNIAFLFCFVLVLLLAGLYLITRQLSLKLWLPFYSTLRQIENFELDKNVNPRLSETDVEEFNRLNQAVNRLLTKNMQVYQDQKEFIENAAHELQTPLAIFQAKMDVLVQQIPFNHMLGETLSQLHEAISRLNRINKNLLLLSKISNNQYEASPSVSVTNAVEKQITFLKEQAAERHLTVHDQDIEPTHTKANSALLEIAISNLYLNALRYNYEGGDIEVSLIGKTLTVSNTSTHPALSEDKLFQRFHAGKDGSNGLGLSIVKKICDFHGWSLQYRFEESKHFFTIVF